LIRIVGVVRIVGFVGIVRIVGVVGVVWVVWVVWIIGVEMVPEYNQRAANDVLIVPHALLVYPFTSLILDTCYLIPEFHGAYSSKYQR
jgi:hypothetical protein